MTRPVRVLVVDDSAFTRKAVTRMLQTDPALKVTAQARDGAEALALASEQPFDVVTLDLEMPGMSGIETLERLRQCRLPVVVLSGAAGGGATLRALDLGAFDVVAKPAGGHLAIHGVTQDLVSKVRGAAGLPVQARGSGPLPALAQGPRRAATDGLSLVVIGISTGGPPALQRLVPALDAAFPVPILVLQHMPPGYTRALAERLDGLAAIAVKEAEEGDALLPGRVLVAPAGLQTGFKQTLRGPRIALVEQCPFPSFYRPSIDYTFMEAARCFGDAVLGLVMTGMGSDGAEGLRCIKRAGGTCWAQDEATSTIYGMPRAAAESGVLDAVLPLEAIASRLTAACHAGGHSRGVAPPIGG